MSAENNQSAPSVISVRLLSSNKDIGKLIGEHGRDISQIREQCQAVLHISELAKGVRERVLTVKGTSEQINSAFELICPKFAVDEEKGEITVTLLVPNIMTGRVIGKGGEKIKTIKQQSGASIQVSNDPIENTTERKITVSGTPEVVVAALNPITSVLAENSNRIRDTQMVYYTPGAPPAVPVSSFLSPLLLGAQVPQLNVPAGPKGGFAPAAPALALQGAQEQILTIQINVPANSIGAIIGHRGANIRDIRRQSGAEITVAESSVGDERSIMIKGNLHQNELALYLIQTTLASAPAARAPRQPRQPRAQK